MKTKHLPFVLKKSFATRMTSNSQVMSRVWGPDSECAFHLHPNEHIVSSVSLYDENQQWSIPKVLVPVLAISKSTTAIPQEFQMIPCKAYRKWASGEGVFAYTVRNKSSAATKESSACVVAAQPRYWDYAPFCWKCFTHEDIVRHFGKGWQGSCLSYMTVDHHQSDNLIHNDSG